MFSLRSNSDTRLTPHLALMKLLAVLVIMYRLAHQNNSNYIHPLMAMYLYSTRVKVDAITLLNHLGLSVLYNLLLRKLRDIKAHSIAFINQQATNFKFVSSWDHFECRKNVIGERIGDTVKFRSVIIAIWIKIGWKIRVRGLKQWIWNAKRDVIDPYKLAINVFGSESARIHDQCIKFHHFQLVLAAFPLVTLLYSSVCMPTIDCIKCQKGRKTEVYAFVLSIFNKSLLLDNYFVFKDLNIVQIGIQKEDNRWKTWLTIW